MSFLPESYEGVPASQTKYMKLDEGANKFRVLSSAIVGYEYWLHEANQKPTPVRVHKLEEVPESIRTAKDTRNKEKHFWAFVVLDRKDNEIKILEVIQKSIMRDIEGLVKSEDWGDPKEYDITINRKKTGSNPTDVEYSVMPSPQKKLEAGVQKLYEDMQIDLNKLFDGGDPFGAGKEPKQQLTEKDYNEFEESLKIQEP